HVSAGADGILFATISGDGTAKVFDVINFDMISIIKLGFTPKACCWVHQKVKLCPSLQYPNESNKTRLYDGRGTTMNKRRMNADVRLDSLALRGC
ncbi:hypothetical protein FRC02_011056, partial [Tulasnella sp. 418]